jgi:hypothetical protein
MFSSSVEKETPVLLGLLERDNLNHWTKALKPIDSECYTLLSKHFTFYPLAGYVITNCGYCGVLPVAFVYSLSN